MPAEFWDLPGTSAALSGISAGNLVLFRRAKTVIRLISQTGLASFRNFGVCGPSGAALATRSNRQGAKDAKEVGEEVDAGAALPNWVRFAESMFWLRAGSWRLAVLAVPLGIIDATARQRRRDPTARERAQVNWLCPPELAFELALLGVPIVESVR